MFMNNEKTTLGGGCFWCTEAVFQKVKGVNAVTPGYAGGDIAEPTYEKICTGNTGHAEVIQIDFDPDQVDFQTLLQVFFQTHDPTTLNCQGADRGTQYRSVIFYHNNEQKTVTEKVISEIDNLNLWENPIVTELQSLDIFYPAEKHHHNYYQTHSQQAYCLAVIEPKLSKLKNMDVSTQ